MSGHPAAAQDETVGQRLKRLRLERGFSQRELSAPGVSYAYISRIEAGTRVPSVKALRRLAAKLRVSAAYLETGSDLAPADELELRLSELELAVRLHEPGTEDAAGQLERVLADATATGERETALRARVALALLAGEAGDHARVVELLEPAVEGEPLAPVDHVDLYAELGRAHARAGRPELAVALYRRCLETVRSTEALAPLEARYATLLGHALSDAGDVAGAEEAVAGALARVGNAADAYTRVRLYRSVARLSHAQGLDARALANARRALALLHAADDSASLARAHLLSASIRLARGDADAASGRLDEAERLLAPAGPLVDGAALRVGRARVAALRGDGAAAAELAREALAAIGDELPAERGAALAALADGLALGGSPDEADTAYRQAVDLLGRHHRRREAMQVCRAWARMLRGAGREAEALDVLDRAAGLGMRAVPADSIRS